MSDFGKSLRRAAAVFAAAICVICGITALVCGVYMAMRGITPGATVNARATFYLSGESASDETASVIAAGYRRDGEAGVIHDGFVIKRLYTDKDRALQGGEVLELVLNGRGFSGERAERTAEFYTVAAKAVKDLSALSDEIDDGKTSESLASLTVGEYAVFLGGYSDCDAGEVAAESAALLIGCAAEGNAVGVKRSAVLLAILLSTSLDG